MASTDTRRAHFASLPEPRKEVEKVQHLISDGYMLAIEKYIDRLSDRVRAIQEEERVVTDQFSAALHSLQAKPYERRREREDVARDVYQKKISKIRDKRRKYREMLYDAYSERKKLIDSMQIQLDEDAILRRKLAKLNALSAGETNREQRKTSFFDKSAALFMVLQILFIIIFAVVADYDDVVNTTADVAGRLNPIAPYYQFYTDVALFVLVGFSFLLSFLRKYQYSAIAFTLLTVATAFQWTIIVSQFFIKASAGQFSDIVIRQQDLLRGFYGAAVCVISFGAFAGFVSAFQLLLVSLVEVLVYGLNVYLSVTFFNVYNNDADEQTAPEFDVFGFGGDATHVHVFAAVFGLAFALPFGRRLGAGGRGAQDRTSSYTSDTFAMLGTIFLFVLWPSFNAALAPASTQHRVVVNTVLSLCASVVFAFLGSRVFRGGKFEMNDIENATLAGGVGIGTSAAFLITPGAAMIVGAICAIVSTIGYAYISPMMIKWGFTDVRGVLNLHLLPGIIGALANIVSIAIAFDTSGFVYGQRLLTFFPAGADAAGFHLISLLVTIALAGLTGGFFGWFFSRFSSPSKRLFTDESSFYVPSDFDVSVAEIIDEQEEKA